MASEIIRDLAVGGNRGLEVERHAKCCSHCLLSTYNIHYHGVPATHLRLDHGAEVGGPGQHQLEPDWVLAAASRGIATSLVIQPCPQLGKFSPGRSPAA